MPRLAVKKPAGTPTSKKAAAKTPIKIPKSAKKTPPPKAEPEIVENVEMLEEAATVKDVNVLEVPVTKKKSIEARRLKERSVKDAVAAEKPAPVSESAPKKGMSKSDQEKLHEAQVALESRKKKKIKKKRPAAVDDNVDEENKKDVPLRGMKEVSKPEQEKLHEGQVALESRKKKKIKKKRPAAVDDNVDEENKKDVPLSGMEEMDKPEQEKLREGHLALESRKKKKMKKKGPAAVDDNLDEEYKEDVPLRGMKKWLLDYHSRRPGLKVLQQEIDDFIVDHEAQAEKERKEREAAAAAEGWTVVGHQKGRKKNVDSESGIAVGSVGLAAAQAKNAKKKAKESAVTFYRFQRREARRNEILELQNKFEEDKKRIAQMRAARKFRPY